MALTIVMVQERRLHSPKLWFFPDNLMLSVWNLLRYILSTGDTAPVSDDKWTSRRTQNDPCQNWQKRFYLWISKHFLSTLHDRIITISVHFSFYWIDNGQTILMSKIDIVAFCLETRDLDSSYLIYRNIYINYISKKKR